MSNNRFVWRGLAEMREELRRLPADLADEGGAIVQEEGEGAHRDIGTNYPKRTGKLARMLKLDVVKGRFGTAALVRNTAKHAYLFEHGTQARHTAIGANRGSTAPGNVFVPQIIRHRRAMFSRLKDLLNRKGLRVSGNA